MVKDNRLNYYCWGKGDVKVFNDLESIKMSSTQIDADLLNSDWIKQSYDLPTGKELQNKQQTIIRRLAKGNWGHSGRPGQIGGSGVGVGGGISSGEAVEFYQNNGYELINNYYRGQGKLSSENKGKAKKYGDKMDSIIAEQSEQSYYAFRGDGAALSSVLFEKTGISKEMKEPLSNHDDFFNKKPPSQDTWNNYFNNKLKGQVFEDKGFVSTSSSQKIAKERFVTGGDISKYGCSGLIKIQGKGKFIDAGKYSTINAEKELILPRNTKFKISSVRAVPFSREGYSGTRGESFYLEYEVGTL